MRVIPFISAGTVLLGLAVSAGAQDRATAPRKAEPRIQISGPEDCRNEKGKVECVIIRRGGLDSAMMKRAALGIQLEATGSLRDTIGVFVSRVTPEGPAENAGVIEGDRIVAINGVDLRVNSADAGDRYASELPGRRLAREVNKASPGDRISLRVWSAGRIRDVQVVAVPASELNDNRMFGMMGMAGWAGDMPRFRMNLEPAMGLTGPLMRLRSMDDLDSGDVRVELRDRRVEKAEPKKKK